MPPAGGADRKAQDRLFRKNNLADRLRPAMVCGLVGLASQYVTVGVGVALMYVTEEVVREAPGLQLRALDPDIERLPIEMAVRKSL